MHSVVVRHLYDLPSESPNKSTTQLALTYGVFKRIDSLSPILGKGVYFRKIGYVIYFK